MEKRMLIASAVGACIIQGRMNFNPYNILAGLIFGTLGMASFSYGKKLELWKPKVIGIALMFYAYLTPNVWLTWAVGVILVVTLWFHHDE